MTALVFPEGELGERLLRCAVGARMRQEAMLYPIGDLLEL